MPSLMGMTNSAFDPASRVRFIQFMDDIEKAGWTVDFRPNRPDRQWKSQLPGRLPRAAHYRLGRIAMRWNRWTDVRDASRADVVFVNRDLAGGGLFFERKLIRENPCVVYDFDDAVFVGPNEPAVAWMCRNAAWVTPGNAYLADFVRKHTDRYTVVPTVIDTRRYSTRDEGRSWPDGRVRVGWSGSDQSDDAYAHRGDASDAASAARRTALASAPHARARSPAERAASRTRRICSRTKSVCEAPSPNAFSNGPPSAATGRRTSDGPIP